MEPRLNIDNLLNLATKIGPPPHKRHGIYCDNIDDLKVAIRRIAVVEDENKTLQLSTNLFGLRFYKAPWLAPGYALFIDRDGELFFINLNDPSSDVHQIP